MLDNYQSKEELWQGVQGLVIRWLAERQEVVILYCALAGSYDYSNNCNQSITKLRHFCQTLMDYVSAGHFEIYNQLVKEAEEFDDNSQNALQKMLPKITTTTEMVLDFNDTYDTDEHCEKAIGILKEELSLLGEHLINRFEIEDQLIEVMHAAHIPTATPA